MKSFANTTSSVRTHSSARVKSSADARTPARVKSSVGARSFVKGPSFARAAARLFVALVLAASALALNVARASAQDRGRLRLDSLERLAPKATDTVNVEVDGFLIKLASKILSDKDPDEKTAKEIISGLRGVYVRSYEFGKEGEYADSDIAPIREQLRAPAWTRLVGVRSHADGDDAEIYVATEAGRVQGLTVLVAEPKEVTVINIVGDIDVEKLKRLEGSLGIPRIHIEHRAHTSRRDDDK
jgi:Domain of unknown function (DUF4252)